MGVVNAAITRIFDLFFAPFAGLGPWFGLGAVSAVTGLVAMLVFRAASNQRAIAAVKSQIIAHLLEVLLYRDELRVIMRAQARLLRDNLKYFTYALVPLACMIVPIGLLMVQTELRYGHRPLRVGEEAVVTLTLEPGADLDQVTMTVSPGLRAVTPPVRIPTLNEVDWRIAAVAEGAHELRFSLAGKEFTKQVVVGKRPGRVARARVDDNLWAQIANPGEPLLPGDLPVRQIAVSYPKAEFVVLGRRLHWIWPWLAMSMLFGYALKGPLRVQI